MAHIRVVVGDDITDAAVCGRHAEWLRAYADATADVTVMSESAPDG